MKQLALPISLNESATLDNFIAGRNGQLIHFLRRFLEQRDELQAYLWAHGARGKSHLLQAMCQLAAARKRQASYLPMRELARLDAAMLDGLETLQLLAIDDLQVVANDPVWAEAIFHLINRCRNGHCRLLLAATESPQSIQVALPDLASRLVWGPVFHLDPLADDELLAFVFNLARQRGLNLSAEVAHYLVKHLPRDIRYLETLIRLLDEETMASKRRVTLPLVKLVMQEHRSLLEAGTSDVS